MLTICILKEEVSLQHLEHVQSKQKWNLVKLHDEPYYIYI